MSLISFVFLLILLILISEFVVNSLGQASEFDTPDMIVLLGSGNKVDEPLLNDRLEATIIASQKYPNAKVLVTGDEKNKQELSSMKKYLEGKIPQDKLVFDGESLKTWDSFLYIKKNYPQSSLLIITNEFHQRRSLFFAHLLNLKARCHGKDHSFSQNWILFVRERISRLLAMRYIISK